MLYVVYDDLHWLHRDPSGMHPENPDRLEKVVSILRKPVYRRMVSFYSEEVFDESTPLLVHSREYVDWIKLESRRGFHYIDGDTYVNEHTYKVAVHYTSLSRIAALRGYSENGIWVVLPRPPGHHAGINGSALGAPTQGFCIFNNVAVAVKSLLEKTRMVLVIDFDAHHGNGTQEIFWEEPRVIHVDLHQHGIYPGTGWVTDMGGGAGKGSKVNIPLNPFTGDNVYLWVLENIIEKLVEKYNIDAIAVSAGFDSYRGDPLTELDVTETTYANYGYYLYSLVREGLAKTVVAVLEGGYGEGLKKGFEAFLQGLLGWKTALKKIETKPPPRSVYNVLKKILQEYHDIEI